MTEKISLQQPQLSKDQTAQDKAAESEAIGRATGIAGLGAAVIGFRNPGEAQWSAVVIPKGTRYSVEDDILDPGKE